MKTVAIILAICFCCVQSVEITPAVITDSYGNHADQNSKIDYAVLPAGDEYVVKPEEYTYNGLLPLIKGMQGFVHIAFGKDTPWDTFLGLITGSAAFGQELILSMAKWGAGYAACVVIGLLFFLIFPLVACIFCCCRTCCGNCGGKMIQKRDENRTAWRACLFISLFISCTFLGCGMICTYVVNERMTTLFTDITTTVSDNIEDLNRYGNNTLMQVNYVAKVGYNFTAQVMLRDLNNIGPIVGGEVQNSFNEDAGVDEAFDQLLQLDPLLKSLVDGFSDVETKKAAVILSIGVMETTMVSLADDIDFTFDACGAPCSPPLDTSNLKSGSSFNPSNMPDFETQLQELEDVQATNITALVLEGKREFQNITEIVEDKASSVTTTITDMINSFDDVISDAMANVNDMLDIFESISNLTDSIGNLGAMKIGGSLTVDDLEKYRWMGGVGLTCFVLLILVLQLLGLILGCLACCCCGDKNTLPTQRSSAGNCGGLFLMASVGIVFIFGALIMLLVWLTYLVGAPMEQLICVNLRDPEYSIFKTLIDGGDPSTGPYSTILGEQSGYTMGKMIFNNDTVPITVAGLLTDCENNEPAWKALFIDRFFNIETVLNYQSTIDIDGEIDKISVDLSNLELLNANTKTQLLDMKSAISDIDFDGLEAELAGNTVEVDFSSMAERLREAADRAGEAGLTSIETEFLVHKDELLRIESEDYADVKTSQDSMLVSVRSMNATSYPVPNRIDTLIETVENTQNTLQSNGVEIVKNESKVFAHRVLGVAEQFVSFVNSSIRGELGRCKPVSNLYQSILINTLCGSVIDSWNCVWFSLGWCLFFMVLGIILSTKLAKHVRKMDELDENEPGTMIILEDLENVGHLSTYKGSKPCEAPSGHGKGKVHPAGEQGGSITMGPSKPKDHPI